MQDPRAIDAIPLMVTPWNLPRIRDLGQVYLTEARGCLSLMNEATDAHRQAKQEHKHEYRKSYEHFRILALHTHCIACDLFLSETTLGQEAMLVQLVEQYHSSSQQESGPLSQIYQQAASQLSALLSPTCQEEMNHTLVLVQAMQQATLLARRRRSRKPCVFCSQQKGEVCQREALLLKRRYKRERSARQLLSLLPAAEALSFAQIEQVASACAGSIAAAYDWHRHCFGSLGS